MRAYLRKIEPAAGMARFYAVTVVPTLFGEWSVIREWGRIGQGGTVREGVVGSQAEAESSFRKCVEAKKRRGYSIVKSVARKVSDVAEAPSAILMDLFYRRQGSGVAIPRSADIIGRETCSQLIVEAAFP